MKCFTDTAGRVWTLAVNVATLKRVRALCGIDLANIITLDGGSRPDASLLERLASDPVLLVDVLYALCKEEAGRRNVTDTDFGASMAGDAIEQAAAALLDEIVDFFPSAKRRVMKRIMEATRRFGEKAETALAAALESPRLDAALNAALERLTGLSATSPASSE